ncbi:hypothetical protein DERF_002908 [Dermatophagoides farinae]|uniref:Uncharacterized protein n=1 Tax=Dermatophagoides farinae TaxID=6954 RepID=A0A922LDF3_DERFA|nr:hypothetical protein DERF_002908 [Dermatophagoides farinae]
MFFFSIQQMAKETNSLSALRFKSSRSNNNDNNNNKQFSYKYQLQVPKTTTGHRGDVDYDGGDGYHGHHHNGHHVTTLRKKYGYQSKNYHKIKKKNLTKIKF